MCIVCRNRMAQKSLLRLQCRPDGIFPFSGSGRSFYLCEPCFDDKKLNRALARQCKTGDTHMLLNQLKEIIADVR